MTIGQLWALFEACQETEYRRMRFNAGIQGVDLDKEVKKKQKKKADDELKFRSPEEYEKMDPEERKRLTEKMMQHWKGVLGGGPFSG